VAPTDFIFSVIAEEAGFLGSLLVLGLYAVVLTGGIRAAIRAPDKAGRLLAAGYTAMLFCHMFVNIAMTVGLAPITGLPLPLISYGGSFMVCTLAGLGMVQSVYVRRMDR
jgi:rod shape determining protein RodA